VGELINVNRGHVDDAADRSAVGRRALLKAVAAGGAFAVPLIASFSMDATAANAMPSAPLTGNMTSVVYGCANQAGNYAPSGIFFVSLVTKGTQKPVRGYIEIEVVGQQDVLTYDIGLSANVTSPVSSFEIITTSTSPASSLWQGASGNFGSIRGKNINCANGTPAPAGLDELFNLMRAGKTEAVVQLNNGTVLTGPISYL
jgi:hypothetical protein